MESASEPERAIDEEPTANAAVVQEEMQNPAIPQVKLEPLLNLSLLPFYLGSEDEMSSDGDQSEPEEEPTSAVVVPNCEPAPVETSVEESVLFRTLNGPYKIVQV